MGALILAVVLIGSAHLMMQTSVTVQQQQLKREATVSASTVMENYWRMAYDDLLDLAGTSQSFTIDVTGVALDVVVTVRTVTDAEGTDCVEIAAVVDRAPFVEAVGVVGRRYQYGLSQAIIDNS